MKFLVIDDEQLALDRLVRELKTVVADAQISSFMDPDELISFVELNKDFDVAFLDIQMTGITGVELAKKLKEFIPNINIIFVTGYEEYAKEAMKLHASGYIMKPVDADEIKNELQDLRHPIDPKKNAVVKFKCFGNFDVLDSNDMPVYFERKKAKELLAYLVYRQGAQCTTQELFVTLFEDGKYNVSSQQRLFQTIITSLTSTLKSIGAESIILRNYGTVTLDVHKVDCDWYDLLNSSDKTNSKYRGEFMSQYSWAEDENGNLARITKLYY